jgi:hypothetical protein
VLERVREMLVQRLVNATVPTFTVSFGLASGDERNNFNEVVARADAALLTAKRQGRDRIVIAADLDATVLAARVASPSTAARHHGAPKDAVPNDGAPKATDAPVSPVAR